MISGETRTYKGHTVKLYGGIFSNFYTYELNGKLTQRGHRGRPTARGAWKAAKSEINRSRKEWAVLTSRRLRQIGSEYLSHGTMSGDKIASQEILCICEELLDMVK